MQVLEDIVRNINEKEAKVEGYMHSPVQVTCEWLNTFYKTMKDKENEKSRAGPCLLKRKIKNRLVMQMIDRQQQIQKKQVYLRKFRKGIQD